MNELERDRLRALLISWRDGRRTAREVHEEAEALMERFEWRELPKADPRSIQYEVLSQLDVLNHQWITTDDIDAFLEFLAAPEGGEERAWARWEEYWDSVDYDARRETLRGNPDYAV